jgi:hypothetical protein
MSSLISGMPREFGVPRAPDFRFVCFEQAALGEETAMVLGEARLRRVLAIVLVLTTVSAGPASSAWVEQGPGPILRGQSEGITNNPVSGAVTGIAVDPLNANTVYLATVNGGVWKTTNATAPSPTWFPLTDQQLPALSINSLAMSPLDSNTLFAGTGSTSSDAFDGSPGFGVARSTDGGTTWTVLATSTFAGRRINSIVPTTLTGSGG